MESLADNGKRSYAYVDTLDEAEKLFVEDLTSTRQVIAPDAKVRMDFNPNVIARYRLIGYENRAVADQDFRSDSVDSGHFEGLDHHIQQRKRWGETIFGLRAELPFDVSHVIHEILVEGVVH